APCGKNTVLGYLIGVEDVHEDTLRFLINNGATLDFKKNKEYQEIIFKLFDSHPLTQESIFFLLQFGARPLDLLQKECQSSVSLKNIKFICNHINKICPIEMGLCLLEACASENHSCEIIKYLLDINAL